MDSYVIANYNVAVHEQSNHGQRQSSVLGNNERNHLQDWRRMRYEKTRLASELHVRFEAFDDLRREVGQQPQVVETFEWAVQAAVIGDRSGHVE